MGIKESGSLTEFSGPAIDLLQREHLLPGVVRPILSLLKETEAMLALRLEAGLIDIVIRAVQPENEVNFHESGSV